MRRLAGGIAIAGALVALVGVSSAELENHVFTSREHNVRVVVPRGWRESDAPSYPSTLLWMMRDDAKIVLAVEPMTHALFCSWPVRCRTSHDLPSLTARYACALHDELEHDHHMHVGLVESGPKENADAGLPSVWFEYDDGHHFLRQAIAVADSGDRAISLVLAAPSSDQRAAAVRSYEQALRTLRPLSEEELEAGSGSAAADSDSGPGGSGSGSGSGSAAGSAAGSADAASPTSVPAGAPKIDPTGPCS